jgi:hypothetical protein
VPLGDKEQHIAEASRSRLNKVHDIHILNQPTSYAHAYQSELEVKDLATMHAVTFPQTPQ